MPLLKEKTSMQLFKQLLNEETSASNYSDFLGLVKDKIIYELNYNAQVIDGDLLISSLKEAFAVLENNGLPNRAKLHSKIITKKNPGEIEMLLTFTCGICDVKYKIEITIENEKGFFEIAYGSFVREKYLSKRFLEKVGDYESRTEFSDENRYDNSVMLVRSFKTFYFDLVNPKYAKDHNINTHLLQSLPSEFKKAIDAKVGDINSTVNKFNEWYFDCVSELGGDIKLHCSKKENSSTTQYSWQFDVGSFDISNSGFQKGVETTQHLPSQ